MPHLSTVSKETLTKLVVDSWEESPHIVTLPDLLGENISCRNLPVYLVVDWRCIGEINELSQFSGPSAIRLRIQECSHMV